MDLVGVAEWAGYYCWMFMMQNFSEFVALLVAAKEVSSTGSG
jgi:hypothetical protein